MAKKLGFKKALKHLRQEVQDDPCTYMVYRKDLEICIQETMIVDKTTAYELATELMKVLFDADELGVMVSTR